MARKEQEGESFLSVKRSSETYNFPQSFSDYIKNKGDIYYWPQGGFHVVTKADLAKDVLMNPIYSADRASFFISRMPNVDLSLIKDFFGVVSNMMVMSDGKKHSSRRKAGGTGINEDLLKKYEVQIQNTVNELVKPLKSSNQIEFVEGIARELPQSVLADLFSIPKEDRSFFNRCSNTMTGFFGGAVEYNNDVAKEVNQAAINISDYFKDLIKIKRAKPGEDFFSKMLSVQDHFGLSDDEVISQAVMMLVAGQVTTTDQICNNFYLMMSRPGLFKILKDSPHLMVTATEEFKRFDPAVSFLFRVATEDTVLGEQSIKKGETVFVASHCINRDPKMFEKPNELNIERQQNKHFAYGHGPHYCIGARLGRMQMSILFNTLLSEFPSLKLDTTKPIERDHYSLSFSGFKSLPVVL